MKTIAIFDDLENMKEDYDNLMMKSPKTNKYPFAWLAFFMMF